MLKLNHIRKIYHTASKENVIALSDICLSFDKNGLVFIVGQSGSGKTTFLNLIGGLDVADQGEILIEGSVLGKDISLEKYRQNYVGFVFQEYNLLDNLTVYENIAIAVSDCSKKELEEKIAKVLEEVGLSGYEKRRINELSGGQRQRVAIARALAKNTSILLCDEPTGNLDSRTSIEIFDLLKKISVEKTVIVVSHNEELAKEYADRLIRISDGKVISDQQSEKTADRLNGKTDDHLSGKTVNNVPFRSKLKLGFKNLLKQKFKTLIACLLLLFSLVSVCAMQICLSYNSEHSIAASLSDEKTVIVLQNNSTNGVSNTAERYPMQANLSEYVSENSFFDGYRTIHGTVFIGGDAEIGREFYANHSLGDGEAYISDYLVDIIINLNDSYRHLSYTNYEDLLGQEVVYQDTVLFQIAGVFKTDYKEYLDERGNQREDKIAAFEDERNYTNTYQYKRNYEYHVIYTTPETFHGMDIGINSSSYRQDEGYQIDTTESNYSTTLSNIHIYNSSRVSLQYFDNSGYLNATNQTDGGEGVRFQELQDDEIVISGELYNHVFGSNIDWEAFRMDYQYGIDSGNYFVGGLSNLGKTMDISIRDPNGNVVVDVSNKKIVGVDSDIRYDEGETFFGVYGTKECFHIQNTALAEHYVSQLQWDTLNDKEELLKDLRDRSIVVAGTQAMLIYEKEYIISQISYFLIAVSIVLAILTVISTINLVNAKIRDNQKEIGILMGIGYNNKDIIFIYLFSIICMLAFSLVMTLGIIYAGVSVANMLLQTSPFTNIVFFDVNAFTYLTILLAGLVMVVFSFIPLLKLSKQKPIDIIKNQ